MSKSTPATLALAKAGAAFTLHSYVYDPGGERVGLQAAEALGEAPERVLKTLMAKVDGKPVCAILPSDRTVAMKKLAAALGGKAAEMMTPADRISAGSLRKSSTATAAAPLGSTRIFSRSTAT